MALESLPKIAPALFSAEQDLIQIYNKKSDTFGVINASLIGGNTPPSGVSGAIQFSNGSAFASDASNLFWDNVNKRWGVGTNAPSANLHIIGANQLANTYNTKIEGASGFGIFSIANDGAAQIGDYTGNGFQSSLYFLRPSGASRASRLIQGNADLTLTNAVGGFVMNGLQCTIKGSGSTSATTSLLVQNSAGSQLLKITDNGITKVGGNGTFGYLAFGRSSDSTDIGDIQVTSSQFFQFTEYGGNGFRFLDGFGKVPMFLANGKASVNKNAIADASAQFEVVSTTGGILFPRMTTTQINNIASPAEGLIAYNTTISHLCCYQAGAWVKFSHSPM